MTYAENVLWLTVIACILVSGLIIVAYFLGRKEGYYQAKDEFERKQIRRSLASFPSNKNRRRTW